MAHRGDPRDPLGRASEISTRLPDIEGMSPGHRREYVRSVDPGFGFSEVSLTLTVPFGLSEGRTINFAEHARGSRTVIATAVGAVWVSDDLGESWRRIALENAAGVKLKRCFTTRSGHRLVQCATRDPTNGGDAISSTVFRYAPDWTAAGVIPAGEHNWHGSRSIDQAGDTIMWAEYPSNKTKYLAGREHEALSPRVYRSRDDGLSWETVFEQSGYAIRHFHTLVADPFVPGQWWLSSGDRAHESRVWISKDDGDRWIDVTNEKPDVGLHPSYRKYAQAVQRYTDVWIGEDQLIWGSDDWLGRPELAANPEPDKPRAGARMFRSPRCEPLQPEDIGWVGSPVRSMIDVGPALIVTTEAKRRALGGPKVYLVAKDGSGLIEELCVIDSEGDVESALTTSLASAEAVDGHFFSLRGEHDLVSSRLRLLHWHVAFA